MIYCPELQKNFDDYDSLFKELVSKSEQIMELKKSAIKFSEGIDFTPIKIDSETAKELNLEAGYVYPVINTTKYLDSHRDLHLDGLWKKTIKEQKGKIYYATNHELKIGSIIAYPKDVTPFTQTMKWSELGKDYDGETEALIYKVKLQDYANEDAKKAIEHKLPVQNSVSMIYQKIQLAIDSNDKEYSENKRVFDKYISDIANRDDHPELKYFWVVTEAKISREGSMVPKGSNEATPILYPKAAEPSKEHSAEEEADTNKSLSDENLAFVRALKNLVIN